MKYTKGEWKLSSNADNKFIRETENIDELVYLYCVDLPDHKCAIYSVNYDKEIARANAKLIAAAPELLDALIELAECDYTSGTHLSCAIIKAKQAIKKATE